MTLWATDEQGSTVPISANREGDGFSSGQTVRLFDTDHADVPTRADRTTDQSIEQSADGHGAYSPDKGLGIRAGTSLLDATRFDVRVGNEGSSGEMTADSAYLINMAML